jgi:hypothetical protein
MRLDPRSVGEVDGLGIEVRHLPDDDPVGPGGEEWTINTLVQYRWVVSMDRVPPAARPEMWDAETRFGLRSMAKKLRQQAAEIEALLDR